MSYQQNDDDEGLADSEGLDGADVEDGDSADTAPCPYCGRAITEHAEVCTHCGNYISVEDVPSRKSPWMVIGVVILLAVIVRCWVLSKPQP